MQLSQFSEDYSDDQHSDDTLRFYLVVLFSEVVAYDDRCSYDCELLNQGDPLSDEHPAITYHVTHAVAEVEKKTYKDAYKQYDNK